MIQKVLLATWPVALFVLVGCSAEPTKAGAVAAPDALVHEYRTGSLMVQKEKHVTTEEERKAARELLEQIRSTPAGAPARP